MPLTGPQIGRIHKAILAAYDRDELERVLLTCMDIEFDHVVARTDFSAQVFALSLRANRSRRQRLRRVSAACRTAVLPVAGTFHSNEKGTPDAYPLHLLLDTWAHWLRPAQRITVQCDAIAGRVQP